MEDMITRALQKQTFGFDVLELDSASLQRLEEMVLYDIIRLKEIPLSIRVSNQVLYIYAFRAAAISTQRYREELRLLQSDIGYLQSKTDSCGELYKRMEQWITRCCDYHGNTEKENPQSNHSTAGGGN